MTTGEETPDSPADPEAVLDATALIHGADGADDNDFTDDDFSDDSRDLVDIPAVEVISRAAVLLMSAAAEQLGLAASDPDRPEHRDLDQARTLITALAGLLKASLPDSSWVTRVVICVQSSGLACLAMGW